MHKRIAFLTMDDLSDFVSDDDLLIAPLGKLGIDVEMISWRSEYEWDQLDAVVIRSTWDYQSDVDRFMEALSQIEQCQTLLLNPYEVVRWNVDKRYLREMESSGTSIVPTKWFDRFEWEDIVSAAESFESDSIVIKPTISANADNTFAIKLDELRETLESTDRFTQAFEGKNLMVQPFVDSVTSDGEFSLFLIGGEVTHAIIKRPKAGDFRVQEEYGGTISAIEPDQRLLDFGHAVSNRLPAGLLYARIDCVKYKGALVLMEIELIEPSLYFRFSETAINQFTQTLKKLI